MRATQAFVELKSLGLSQPTVPFVDVDVYGDTKVFIEPLAIAGLSSPWANSCVSAVQTFFQEILKLVQAGQTGQARALLRNLKEPNETHLGMSKGRAKGRSLGDFLAKEFVDALSQSQAAQTGLIRDLEDTILLIPKIGPDIVSDITTNLIRRQLIAFTQDTCNFYGLPMAQRSSGALWNGRTKQWESDYVDLPGTPTGGKLLLVPKSIVRARSSYSAYEYFNSYLIEYLRNEEIRNPMSSLVTVAKGRRRVTKKALVGKYGSTKSSIIQQTLRHPKALDDYRKAKAHRRTQPPSHSILAGVTNSAPPDWDALLKAVTDVPAGNSDPKDATRYHHAVEALLSALFYPHLLDPLKELEIHDGRKRIDISYTNNSPFGFFNWLAQHYPAPNIFVECKNYARPLKNPEFDQIAGRFSPSRGTIGILAYRTYSDKSKFLQTCRDTANDQRGFILPIDDQDLTLLVKDAKVAGPNPQFPVLRDLFDRLIL